MFIRKAFHLALLTLAGTLLAKAATIDAIAIGSTLGFYDTWNPTSALYPYFPEPLLPKTFFLSDGSSTFSGAGSSFVGHLSVSNGMVIGNRLTYDLTPQLTTAIDSKGAYTGFAYSMGVGTGATAPEWSQAVLDFTSPMNLVATVGSSQATVAGFLKYVSPIMYPADGYPAQGGLTAQIGDLLPFSLTFTLHDGTWDLNTFDSSFQYSTTGLIGTVPSAVPEPPAFPMLGAGLLLLACVRIGCSRFRLLRRLAVS